MASSKLAGWSAGFAKSLISILEISLCICKPKPVKFNNHYIWTSIYCHIWFDTTTLVVFGRGFACKATSCVAVVSLVLSCSNSDKCVWASVFVFPEAVRLAMSWVCVQHLWSLPSSLQKTVEFLMNYQSCQIIQILPVFISWKCPAMCDCLWVIYGNMWRLLESHLCRFHP